MQQSIPSFFIFYSNLHCHIRNILQSILFFAALRFGFDKVFNIFLPEGRFLFYDENGMPLVAMHWQHRFNRMVGRYNDIYRVQMPNITPHVCRHTYCSNMAKSGMDPKTLQYLMGHSDISVTMNVYTHIGFDDAEEELKRMEEFRKAQAEIEKKNEKPMSQKMFKAI